MVYDTPHTNGNMVGAAKSAKAEGQHRTAAFVPSAYTTYITATP